MKRVKLALFTAYVVLAWVGAFLLVVFRYEHVETNNHLILVDRLTGEVVTLPSGATFKQLELEVRQLELENANLTEWFKLVAGENRRLRAGAAKGCLNGAQQAVMGPGAMPRPFCVSPIAAARKRAGRATSRRPRRRCKAWSPHRRLRHRRSEGGEGALG